MTWLSASEGAATPFEGVLGLRPELLERYRAFYGALWDEKVLPPRILELCRLRVAGLHRCGAEGAIEHSTAGVTPTERQLLKDGALPDSLDPRERLALSLADPVSFAVHDLTDAQVAEVRDAFGEAETVALFFAISLFDLNCRLRIGLEIATLPTQLDPPASKAGRLF